MRTNKGVVEVVFFPAPLDDALAIEMTQEGDRSISVLSGPVVGPVLHRINSNRPLFFITGDTLLLATDTPELAELLAAKF